MLIVKCSIYTCENGNRITRNAQPKNILYIKNCADENAVVVCPDGKDCKLEPSGLSSLVMCFNGITIEAAIN